MKTTSRRFSINSWLLLMVIFMPMQTIGAFYEPGAHVERSEVWVSNQSPSAPQQVVQSSPPDPTADIEWSGGMNGVADIQASFNHARAVENSQLGTSLPMMTMPTQAEWNGMSDSEHALWLINSERVAHGLLPLHGLESNVGGVAQYYADYLLNNNTWGHTADGRSPWDRLDANPAIGACHDFLGIAENIFVLATSGSSVPLPIERAVYGWLYDDASSSWGHRHAILWYPYNDNSGSVGREGFLGIGRANGGPYKGPFTQSWNFAEMIVMNVFDPCATWAYAGVDNAQIMVGSALQGIYSLSPGAASLRVAYPGVNGGPARVKNADGTPMVASERVAYSPDGGATWTSYSELMGLPAGQATTSYTFPWYNNVDLNSQLRFANVGNANTTVSVTVGGVLQGTYPLVPNQSNRVSYNSLNAGPVKVTSSGGVPIIASERVAYFDGAAWTSFSELMGLPSTKLTTSYTFPWYNNVDINSQLRFGNVGSAPTNVTVTIGGINRGTYPLAPNASQRVSYNGLNAGPIKVTSSGNVPIIASLRVAYYNGSAWTDFTEMMGMPTSSLSTIYAFPVYNNVDLNSQLRFGNVGNVSTNVTVTIGGVLQGTYLLAPNASQRVSYNGVNSGPVVIQSSGNVPIIASERVAYFDSGLAKWTSFAEMMGLPASQWSANYLFPWYNNVDLDTQLRFGMP